MFYEIDSDGSKIRPLPGYFAGFKDDLKNFMDWEKYLKDE